MTQVRLIPVLLVADDAVVRSHRFGGHRRLGDAESAVRRLAGWDIDELVLLNISPSRWIAPRVLRAAARCAVPLTVGGRLRTLEDIERLLGAGADRCLITTGAVDDPHLLRDAVLAFGGERIVAGVDARRGPDGRHEAVTHRGRTPAGVHPARLAGLAAGAGVAEVFLQSVDRDGTGMGMDLGLIQQVVRACGRPVVACGGAGDAQHLAAAVHDGGASAVASAGLFHRGELSYPRMREACRRAGLPMRPARVDGPWFPREPAGDVGMVEDAIAQRLERTVQPLPRDTTPPARPRWCTRCVGALGPHDVEVCRDCRTARVRGAMDIDDWSAATERLMAITEARRADHPGRHDCVLAVQGEPEDWYLVHTVTRQLGLRPLLVSHDGGTLTAEARSRRDGMADAFGVDHLVVRTPLEATMRVARAALLAAGDPGWPVRVARATVPVRVAVQQGISLVLSPGMSPGGPDAPELTYRDRLAHIGGGLEWTQLVGVQGVGVADLAHHAYPADRDLLRLDLRAPYAGEYMAWDAAMARRLMAEEHGVVPTTGLSGFAALCDAFAAHTTGRDATVHGLGERVRDGDLDRSDALELLRDREPAWPDDRHPWLDRLGLDDTGLQRLADTFRDPALWWRDRGRWNRHQPWETAAVARVA
ncbi:MAG: HisA/HisF-related TIM barrel protein [Thermoleophilia bacterium]